MQSYLRSAFYTHFPIMMALLITLFLSSCMPATKQLSKVPVVRQPPNNTIPTPGNNQSDKVEQILAQAQRQSSPETELLQIQAASLLFERGDQARAVAILNGLDEPLLQMSLNPNYGVDGRFAEVRCEYAVLRTQIALKNQNGQEAVYWLASPECNNTSAGRSIKFSLLRAEALYLSNQFLASARERILVAPRITDETIAIENREGTWQALMAADNRLLSDLVGTNLSRDVQGWVALAKGFKQNSVDIDLQLQFIEQWKQAWPAHPAQQLPKALNLLIDLAQTRPTRIGLMLPLQSSVGQAVRDGFLAAFYQASARGSRVPEVLLYDTDESADVVQLYENAISQGAQLIIGPLRSQAVKQLQSYPQLRIPVLALNYGDNVDPNKIVQFGLSSEDEAKQVALRARAADHVNAAIITPANSDGDRVFTAFAEAWTEAGGQIVNQQSFNNQKDLDTKIQKLLSIESSRKRARQLAQTLAEPTISSEFRPRRRKDVDMVFIYARSSNIIESIKPFFNYYYADDLPLYSTSLLSKINPNADLNDLNGIQFCELPWIIENESVLKNQVETLWPQAKGKRARLYALGADAYQLYPRLEILRQIPQTRVFGTTGVLRLEANGRISRELKWATINNGRPQAIQDEQLLATD